MPRGRNTEAEYEDAHSCAPYTGRFEVADGASDSYDSGRWSQMLVEAFTAGQFSASAPEELDNLIESLSGKWAQEINWEELSWYKEEKARLGAFSSLLGLRFVESEEAEENSTKHGRWRALAKLILIRT